MSNRGTCALERVFGECAAAAAGRHRRVVGAAAGPRPLISTLNGDGAHDRAHQFGSLHKEVAHEQPAVRAAPDAEAFMLRDARLHQVLGYRS